MTTAGSFFGHVAEGVIEPATRMAQRIPVVLTSRVSGGDLFQAILLASGMRRDEVVLAFEALEEL